MIWITDRKPLYGGVRGITERKSLYGGMRGITDWKSLSKASCHNMTNSVVRTTLQKLECQKLTYTPHDMRTIILPRLS